MKKISLVILMSLLFFSLIPTITKAGFVPCGAREDDLSTLDADESKPCQLCDFFVMFDRIVDFVLFKLVPPIATLMLVIGGVMFFAAAGDPANLGRAKGLLTSVVIGLLIVYGAWLLISAFFLAIGVSEWTGLKEGWFNYPCP